MVERALDRMWRPPLPITMVNSPSKSKLSESFGRIISPLVADQRVGEADEHARLLRQFAADLGGMGFVVHAAEVGRELPKQPSMFIRFTDTLIGHEGEMIRPKLSDNFDFEGELTMVIGKGGRHIPIERALDHVAGYTIFVDGSVRDTGNSR